MLKHVAEAVSYLVESTEGYTASLFARFQQALICGEFKRPSSWDISLFISSSKARRHTQGIVELGYAFKLQPAVAREFVDVSLVCLQVFLQWFRLSSSIGFMKVPWRTSSRSESAAQLENQRVAWAEAFLHLHDCCQDAYDPRDCGRTVLCPDTAVADAAATKASVNLPGFDAY